MVSGVVVVVGVGERLESPVQYSPWKGLLFGFEGGDFPIALVH